MSKKELPPKIARWAMLLEDFDYEIIHRPGKQMKHVDALSRYPVMTIQVDETTQKICHAQPKDELIITVKIIITQKKKIKMPRQKLAQKKRAREEDVSSDEEHNIHAAGPSKRRRTSSSSSEDADSSEPLLPICSCCTGRRKRSSSSDEAPLDEEERKIKRSRREYHDLGAFGVHMEYVQQHQGIGGQRSAILEAIEEERRRLAVSFFVFFLTFL
ncbi:uncharacterized protein [Parasteatoda tepidariorum]|uniref:uncharacterized protein n=1 Tax=Parasteatoda tepidariorum TaxID=114398 RepID=UPI001C72485A|nr:uncharacterized protein LOC122272734 [Parasteatoda tepidariorum]